MTQSYQEDSIICYKMSVTIRSAIQKLKNKVYRTCAKQSIGTPPAVHDDSDSDRDIDEILEMLETMIHQASHIQLAYISPINPSFQEAFLPTDEEINDADYVFSGNEVIKRGVPYIE